MKRVRVSYGRTCQSAPYESIRLDVNDDENVKEAIDKSVVCQKQNRKNIKRGINQ